MVLQSRRKSRVRLDHDASKCILYHWSWSFVGAIIVGLQNSWRKFLTPPAKMKRYVVFFQKRMKLCISESTPPQNEYRHQYKASAGMPDALRTSTYLAKVPFSEFDLSIQLNTKQANFQFQVQKSIKLSNEVQIRLKSPDHPKCSHKSEKSEKSERKRQPDPTPQNCFLYWDYFW